MLPYVYRVTKYDPADRDEHGGYIGTEDTVSDHGPVEAAYLQAVAAFTEASGVDHMVIREPTIAGLVHFGREPSVDGHGLALGTAGGEDRAGHSRLMLDGPLRDTWLGQLDDLTGRTGVDIGEDAFADLPSQRSLHARSPPSRGNTSGEQKGTPPVAGPPDTVLAFQKDLVRLWLGAEQAPRFGTSALEGQIRP